VRHIIPTGSPTPESELVGSYATAPAGRHGRPDDSSRCKGAIALAARDATRARPYLTLQRHECDFVGAELALDVAGAAVGTAETAGWTRCAPAATDDLGARP
jgi:hypothetical protein